MFSLRLTFPIITLALLFSVVPVKAVGFPTLPALDAKVANIGIAATVGAVIFYLRTQKPEETKSLNPSIVQAGVNKVSKIVNSIYALWDKHEKELNRALTMSVVTYALLNGFKIAAGTLDKVSGDMMRKNLPFIGALLDIIDPNKTAVVK